MINAAVTPAAAAASAQLAQQGRVKHWGFYFGDGQRAHTDGLRWPTEIYLPGQVAEVGTSNSTEYALLTNGQLYAWGQGTNGQLGDGGLSNSFSTPVQVRFPAGVRIASIATDAMPYDTAMAIDTQGDAWGWGLNLGGELCLGSQGIHPLPVRLPLRDVTTLAGAAGHALYDAGGTLYSCGRDEWGQLGNGTTRGSFVPVKVTGIDGRLVVAVVASFNNSGALLSDGKYYDWGYNGGGQLGNGTISAQSDVPVRASVTLPIAHVALGGSTPSNGHTLVLLRDGQLRGWGSNGSYQLGFRPTVAYPSPVPVYARSGVQYQEVAAGGNTSYGISLRGFVYAWGGNSLGQVGDGTTQVAKTPVRTVSGVTAISSTADNVAVNDP